MSDVWVGTLGCHGLGTRNQATAGGLLGLLLTDTGFQKRNIHLGTWRHPATKEVHNIIIMIDFVVMRVGQRSVCLNVRVMGGANCWSDH